MNRNASPEIERPSVEPKAGRLANRAAVGLWKILYTPLLRRAARQTLKGRLLDMNAPKKGRWLESDVKAYLVQVWARTDKLLPIARLDSLPTYGNRHNVFLAVVTTAAYQILLERATPSDYAKQLIGDLGWKIYGWMLSVIAVPFRLTTRDPVKRMERILRALMFFPFSAPGAPGYEVNVWTAGDNTHTHWTHCPPQTFVRRLVEMRGDRGELDAFYSSWCLYDWPGADILAHDGGHGHYTRTHTLSKGDAFCDMCWYGRVNVAPEARTSDHKRRSSADG
jgi:hypothetical protein